MSTFDAGAFSVQSFSTQSFDLQEVAGAIRGTASGTSGASGTLVGVQAAGRKPRSGQQKRYTLTIRGQRFTVPEDELEIWLARQEEELVAEATKPVVVKKRKVTIQAPKKAPRIVAPQDDGWLRALVAEANRRVSERLEQHRRLLEDDEEAISILMMAL